LEFDLPNIRFFGDVYEKMMQKKAPRDFEGL
jgi:hypothetical protein